MSNSLRTGGTDQVAAFVAYDDSSALVKPDLVAADIDTLFVTRVGATDITIASPTDKTNPNDTHSDGAVYNDGGGDYLLDLTDACCATQVPSIRIHGTWSDSGESTSGTIVGYRHELVAFDKTDGDSLGLSYLDEAVSAAKDITTDAVASIWDALTAGMTTAGSIGKKLADWVVGTLTSAYDPAKSAASQSSVNTALANQATIAGYIDSEVGHLIDFLEADRYIDTAPTPWQLVLIKKGTGGLGVGTELLRQDLKDEGAADISSISDFVGQQVSP